MLRHKDSLSALSEFFTTINFTVEGLASDSRAERLKFPHKKTFTSNSTLICQLLRVCDCIHMLNKEGHLHYNMHAPKHKVKKQMHVRR